MSVSAQDRQHLAAALRALATGKITNDQFENTFTRSTDRAVDAIIDQAWFLYDDLHEHRLKGEYALSPEGRRVVARCLVFLDTGLEYEWPSQPLLVKVVLFVGNLLSIGLLGAILRRTPAARREQKIWPFFRESDLDAAIAALHAPRSAA